MSDCPYCFEGKPLVEILGLWIHQFSDRWITCSPNPNPTVETDIAKSVPPSNPLTEPAFVSE